jgi:xanthine dehydrogenase YagS FAD-binding subunit
MDNFYYSRPRDLEAALRLAAQPGAQLIAGGTNLIDLMKGGVANPARLVDMTKISGLAQIHELPGGGLRIGALVSNAQAADHPLIRKRYPLLSQGILAGASPQLRNMATVGGNLLQRTRCSYFYDIGFSQCNKRQPGSGCAAIEGSNRNHAILGASESCIATNPSDMSVALTALEALVQLRGARGSRQVALNDFQRLPGDSPQLDTNLGLGEIITAVDLPPSPFASNSHYLKIRDRASYAFALVSVAAALQLENGLIRNVQLVLGGVAHRPWRVAEAQAMLVGKPFTAENLDALAVAALRDAQPQKDNGFKVELSKRAIVRALTLAHAARET